MLNECKIVKTSEDSIVENSLLIFFFNILHLFIETCKHYNTEYKATNKPESQWLINYFFFLNVII